jgi:RHS repeat-associated protein
MKLNAQATRSPVLQRLLAGLLGCLVFSQGAFAIEYGGGEELPPLQNWHENGGTICNANYPIIQAPPGADRMDLIEMALEVMNAECSGYRGPGYTTSFTLVNNCDVTPSIASNTAYNPRARAQYACTVRIHADPKPSCGSNCAPYSFTYGNGITAVLVCATLSNDPGAQFSLPSETCQCPVNTKLWDGTCIPLHQQVLKPEPSCCVGNPISPGTGTKLQEEVDYEGTPSIPLRFSRTYNSKAPAAKRWRSNFDRTIDIAQRKGTVLAIVRRADASYGFTGSESGSAWAADKDTLYTLTGPLRSFSVRSPDRREIERYDTTNRLASVRDGSPSAVIKYSLTYSTTSTPASIAPAAGLLIRVTDAFGHALNFTYDANSRMATMIDPAGGLYSYAYDGSGNLISVTYPDLRVRQYVYNEPALTGGTSQPNALTGIIDEDGSRYATFGYSASGLAILSEHAGGAQRFESFYSTEPRLTYSLLVRDGRSFAVQSHEAPTGVTVTDALGAVRTYGFSAVDGVIRATGSDKPCFVRCSSVPLAQVYDDRGNVLLKEDFKGNKTSYVVNPSRNLESSRTEGFGSPVARTITTSWHSIFRLPDLITEANRKTAYTYNDRGMVLTRTVTDTSVSPNVSRKWTFTYDSNSRVLTENGPRTDIADVTTYTYYSCTTGYQCGQVSTITNAAGHVTTYNNYNAHGQPIQITDPNSVVTMLDYDSRQRLTARCVNGALPGCVGGELTAVEYWPTGLLKKVTLPDGSFSSYGYDAAHRLIQVSDSSGNHVDYTLDAMGNRTGEAVYDPGNALRRTHTRVYNSLSLLYQDMNAASTGGATTTYAYDSNGNNTAINAPLSRFTGNAYDELNRLKEITDAFGGHTQFAYDANDELTSVTDPRGLVTSYQLNGFGDTSEVTSPDSGVTHMDFNQAGNVAARTDARDQTALYIYDALNRPTQIQYSDQTQTFAYDTPCGAGRLCQMTDESGTTTWTYTALGRVASKTQTAAGTTWSVGYGYNTAGQLSSITYPSGAVVTYSYANGRISGVQLTLNGTTQTILSDVQYDPFGPVKGWTWGNATSTSRSYDEDGNITQIVSAGTFMYGTDDAGRITSLTDAQNANLSRTFGYDTLDRLQSETSPLLSLAWSHDANGNRLTQTSSAASYNITYNYSATSNRFVSWTNTTFSPPTHAYDAAGNLTSNGPSYVVAPRYNGAGRMSSLFPCAPSCWDVHTYNALGQQVRVSESGQSNLQWVYDEGGHILGEYDLNYGSGLDEPVEETIWLGDIPLATMAHLQIWQDTGSDVVYVGSETHVLYVHTDHLNTPRRLTLPATNAIVWRWDSNAFGYPSSATSIPASGVHYHYNLRMPGQVLTNWGVQNFFRDYDPMSGRYLESDPIGLAGGINTYAYVGSNPVSYSDPTGLASPRRRVAPSVLPPGAFEFPTPNSPSNREWARQAAKQFEDTVRRAAQAVRDFCTADSEEERCQKVYKSCADKCADTYEDNPELLPGLGRDYAARVRRCITECVKAAGCSPYKVP